jgi:PAS domain S-box-containing protein
MRLAGGVVRIGRDSANELSIREINASRRHAEVFLREGSYYIRDLNSTNGTKLNGAEIEESVLKPGDQVAIGDTVFVFEDRPKTDTTRVVTFSEGPAGDESSTVRLDPSKSQFLDPKAVMARPHAAERLARLYGYISNASPILHTQRLLEEAMDCAFEATSADRGFIMLADESGALRPALMRLREPEGPRQRFEVSRRMTQQVLGTGQSVLSKDTMHDGRFMDSVAFSATHVSSFICAPLKRRDTIMGLFYVDTVGATAPLDEEDLEFLTAMALLAGSQFANAKLYGDLLNSTEQMQSILRCLRSGVVVTDLDGKVQQVNEAACELLGVSEDRLVGQRFSDYGQFSSMWKVLDETRSSGIPAEQREAFVTIAGTELPFGVSTSLLRDHEAHVRGVVATFQNLSVIRKLREEVKMSQHLAALGEMAAGIAHEIRNPLNSIRGFAQLIGDMLPEPTGDEAADSGVSYVNIIVEEVDRMNQLVQDLLDFSRQRELTMIDTSPADILLGVLKDLGPDLAQAEIVVQTEIDPGVPKIMASAVKLKQVLVNVVRNAVQAMTPPVAPEGRARRLVASVNPTGKDPGSRDGVEISISDTGMGMDRAALARAFEPFFTTRERGTGLGLAICRKIIQQHGGNIQAESQIGAGTTMRVTLPV